MYDKTWNQTSRVKGGIAWIVTSQRFASLWETWIANDERHTFQDFPICLKNISAFNLFPSFSDNKTSKRPKWLHCNSCKSPFGNAWDLMVHVQTAHMMNIYQLADTSKVTEIGLINVRSIYNVWMFAFSSSDNVFPFPRVRRHSAAPQCHPPMLRIRDLSNHRQISAIPLQNRLSNSRHQAC